MSDGAHYIGSFCRCPVGTCDCSFEKLCTEALLQYDCLCESEITRFIERDRITFKERSLKKYKDFICEVATLSKNYPINVLNVLTFSIAELVLCLAALTLSAAFVDFMSELVIVV